MRVRSERHKATLAMLSHPQGDMSALMSTYRMGKVLLLSMLGQSQCLGQLG